MHAILLDTLLLIAAATAHQTAEEPPVLTAGETLAGEILAEAPVIETERLLASHAAVYPARGNSYRFEARISGPHHFELRSHHFKGYLVLRAASGEVIAEDDFGLWGILPRVSAKLEAGKTYVLDAAALFEDRGPFELRALEGTPAPLDPEERARALSYAREGVRVLEGGGATAALGTALHRLAFLLKQSGKYAEAIELYRRAVRVREEALGPEHPSVMESLGNLAWQLQLRGDYAEARPLLERSLAIGEKVLGPEHPDLAHSLANLAALLDAQGNYAAARPLNERSLAMLEKILGSEHVSVADGCYRLARVLHHQGEYAGARPLYERSLAIWEKTLGPEHPNLALASSSLAGLLVSLGDHAGARPLHERSLAILEKAFGPEHPRVARALVGLAHLHVSEGDHVGARRLYERSLTIQEKALGPEHPDVAESLHYLAALLRTQGDFAGARPLFERSLTIRERALGPEHPDVAMSLNSLGVLLSFQGDQVAARPLLERALAIWEKALGSEHEQVGAALMNLASLLHLQGDYAGARPLIERALANAERKFGPEHPEVATGLQCLAAVINAQGDYAGARPLGDRSLAIREKLLGPNHPDVASSLCILAWSLHLQGDYDGARALYQRALAIWEALGSESPYLAEAQNDLARLLLDAGDHDSARALLARASLDRRRRLHGVLLGLSEAEGYRYLSTLRWQQELLLSLGAAHETPELDAAVYQGMLEWKGRIARALLSSREQLDRGLSAEQAGLVGELHSKQAELSRLVSEGAPLESSVSWSAVERQVHEDRIAALVEERNALELKLKRTLEASGPDPIPTVGELASSLPPRAAVLDLFVHRLYRPGHSQDGEVHTGSWTEDRVSAWIVRTGDPEVKHLDLGPARPIEEAVRAFLSDLVSGRESSVGRGIGAGGNEEDRDEFSWNGALRALLWTPLAAGLDGAETVFVSPDGFLGALPLETIALEDGTFLVERFAFVQLEDVIWLAKRPSGAGERMASLVAMGAVDFRQRTAPERGSEGQEDASARPDGANSRTNLRGCLGIDWAHLPATEHESQVVFDFHGKTFGSDGERLLLQGAGASEERLKHELPRHTVAHLATHGFFQPEGVPSMWESALNERGEPELRMREEEAQLVGKHPGLLSGLVCAGASRPPGDEGDDGYLTAEEVGWLDLSKVELVVLSACETGLGRAQSGEGLIGLRRAFRTAGAKTVVSSLWSVNDESTAELMQAFYTNLWLTGMGRLEALRAAQLAMLHANRREHGAALPSTWGAFVLSGEWR